VTKAVTYLRQFGAKAARSFAHVEAVTAYQQALPHVEHLPAVQQDRARLDLLLRLAFSLSILGRFRDILDLLLPQQERLEHLQEPALMGPYYFRLGITCIYLGTFDQSMQHAQRALAAARHCHDRATLGMSHRLLAWASTSLGRYQQGMTYGRKAVALLENTAEWHWLGLAHWDIGMSAAFLGEFETALEALSHTRMLGEAHEDPRLQHLAESSSGWIDIMRGEWEAGITVCQRILAHSPDPIVELLALLYLGIAYLEQGDPTRAITLLEQVVQRFQHIQLRYAQGRAAAVLAEALLVDKQIEPADHMARQGLEICQETSYPYGIGLAQRSLGRIAQAKGEELTAAQFLHEALHTFTTLQARYELARTHLLLAEFAHQQGNREALTTHLSTARQLFQLLHVPHYVARTEHLAQACERSTSPGPGDA
jgi:tetratricopeptide (TPR) repeat protein